MLFDLNNIMYYYEELLELYGPIASGAFGVEIIFFILYSFSKYNTS